MTYDLYGGKPPHVADNEASIEAAEAVESMSKALRGKIYRHIKKCGKRGATCYEIEGHMNLRHQTASARIRELVLKSLVKDSGLQRRTSTRSFSTVWVLKG